MITRCLGDFSTRIATTKPEAWPEIWRALPEACPHKDCSHGASCREVCGRYAREQKSLLASRESARQVRR